MAINYNAGFLPQNLYDNIANIRQQGYADQRRMQDERAGNLGSLLGNLAKMNMNKGDKALEDLTKQYETQRKNITDQMALLDPRSAGRQDLSNMLTNLDSTYNQKVKDFKGSGFLGTKMFRETDGMSMPGQILPDFDPGDTLQAYALTDAQKQYQDKTNTDLDAIKTRVINEGTAQAELYNDPVQKAMRDAEDTRSFNKFNKELGARTAAEGTLIDRRGAIQSQIAAADRASREAIANKEYERADELQKLKMELMREEFALGKQERADKLDVWKQMNDPDKLKRPSVGDIANVYKTASDMAKNAFGPDVNINDPRYQGYIEEQVGRMLGTGTKDIGRGGPNQPSPLSREDLGLPNPNAAGNGAGKNSGGKEELKTQFPQEYTDLIGMQNADLLDSADNWKSIPADTRAKVDKSVVMMDKLINDYNQTPDSQGDKRKELMEKIRSLAGEMQQLVQFIKQKSNELDLDAPLGSTGALPGFGLSMSAGFGG